MKIYMENKHNIAKHNAAFELGHKNFKLEMNRYGDMVSMNSELCTFC
jgi:cathepsin L